jgi:hypothetical protein
LRNLRSIFSYSPPLARLTRSEVPGRFRATRHFYILSEACWPSVWRRRSILF